MGFGGAVLAGAALPGCSGGTAATHQSEGPLSWPSPKDAEQALTRLREGNGRFVAGGARHPDQSENRRKEVVSSQHPYATILSCVDSRVPPELIFDEGIGDLFVIRTAGQVVDHAVLGSIQFGVEELHIPLVLVLGHSSCGAVKATAEALEKRTPASGSDIDALVAAIKPSVERAKEERATDLVAATVKANIEAVRTSLAAAPVISDAVRERRLQVVGAQYDLANGKVTFD
jgi:carbonic anhydrase